MRKKTDLELEKEFSENHEIKNMILCKKCKKPCENEPLRKGLCIECFIKKNIRELHKYIDSKIAETKKAKR